MPVVRVSFNHELPKVRSPGLRTVFSSFIKRWLFPSEGSSIVGASLGGDGATRDMGGCFGCGRASDGSSTETAYAAPLLRGTARRTGKTARLRVEVGISVRLDAGD